MKSTPTMGDRIRAARLEAGVTNRELALRLGVDQRTVAGYQGKKARSSPPYPRLVQIARLLGKPVSYFIDEDAA